MKSRGKSTVFCLTFFSYVFFHAARKSFSAIKSILIKESWFNSSVYFSNQQSEMCGLLDTLFLMCYAFGLYISGMLGDRHDLRLVISIGMWSSAFAVFLFGFGGLIGIHALSFFAILWAFNGLAQSTGWPSNVAVMGNWFEHSERGAVLGIWSGNASVGNIVGTAVVAIVFSIPGIKHAWQTSLIVVATIVLVHGYLVYRFLIPSPDYGARNKGNDVGDPSSYTVPSEDDVPLMTNAVTPTTAISFCEAWMIPGVIPYAMSYACLKSVNYALFFWLPFFLSNDLGMSDSKADFFSMLYDVGQIAGGFIGGHVSDQLGVRSPVVGSMTLIACILIQLLLKTTSTTALGFLLVACGFFMGGPANLISTAISADLGTHPSLAGNAKALATVTGIIDGTGSIGAAGVQYLVGYLADCRKDPPGCQLVSNDQCKTICSWNPVFITFIIGTLGSIVCLIPLLKKEVRYRSDVSI